MRDYGKVHTSFWTSATTRSMSEDGRTLAMYLLTAPHGTIAGVFRLPDGYACEDLQWTSERVSEGFAELLRNGFANRCETTKWVWIIKHFEWNPPENPNQRKSVAKIASQVPDECCWKRRFHSESGRFWGAEPEKKSNPSGTLSEPFLNQEQEQEQEQYVGAAFADTSQAGPAEPDPFAKQPKARTVRGARLPDDWKLPKAWGEWALTEFTAWTPEIVRLEAEKFADHWHAKAGKDACKTDWQATWRNWCRSDIAQRGKPAAGTSGAVGGDWRKNPMFAGAI